MVKDKYFSRAFRFELNYLLGFFSLETCICTPRLITKVNCLGRKESGLLKYTGKQGSGALESTMDIDTGS